VTIRTVSPVGSWRRRTPVIVLTVAGAGLLVWTAMALHRDHAAWIGGLYVAATTFAFLGVGQLALGLARVDDRRLAWAGLRYVVGFSLTAFLVTMLAYLGLGDISVWVATAVAVCGWAWMVRDVARQPARRPSPKLLAAEFFCGALLLRLVVQGTNYWTTRGATSHFVQYWDDLYHLAMIKDGLYRGLPLRGYALETGVGKVAYHPAVDTMATVFIKALRLPVDPAYFRIVMPILLLAAVVSVAMLAIAWGRSTGAGIAALGIVGISLSVGHLRFVGSEAGLGAVRFFVTNPPSAIGCVGAATCLALVALAEGDRPAGTLVLAGILAGASTLMATPIALVLGPAFVGVLLYRFWRRPADRRALMVAVFAAALTALVSYPTTSGISDGLPAVRLGGLGRHFLGWSDIQIYSPLLRLLVAPLDHAGLVGDEAFLLAVLVLGFLGWHIIVFIVALWRARTRGQRPFADASLATQMIMALLALTVLVALGLGQGGKGPYAPWNVSIHTISVVWWVGVAAAAIALAAALRGLSRPAWLKGDIVWVLSAILIALTLGSALPSMAGLRYSSSGKLPIDLRLMLQQWGDRVPRDAIVVQHFQVQSENWVSAIGGRRVVLERASWGDDLFPAHTAKLKAEIAGLYTTTSAKRARRLAQAMGATYALLSRSDASLGLRGIGAPVLRRGSWTLLRLETS
jgi:hypothetical protein